MGETPARVNRNAVKTKNLVIKMQEKCLIGAGVLLTRTDRSQNQGVFRPAMGKHPKMSKTMIATSQDRNDLMTMTRNKRKTSPVITTKKKKRGSPKRTTETTINQEHESNVLLAVTSTFQAWSLVLAAERASSRKSRRRKETSLKNLL